MRSTKSRPYRMRRRAELVDGTRQRITEATVRLHTTVGPAHTSIAAVAEEAGVTRLTVYAYARPCQVAAPPRPPPSAAACSCNAGAYPRCRPGALSRAGL